LTPRSLIFGCTLYGGMGMPFRFNRTARDLPKRRRCLREWEPGRTRARSCRIDALSGGRSSTEPSLALLILSLADGTIPGPGVPSVSATNSLRPGGGISDFLGALRNGRHGDRTIASSIARDAQHRPLGPQVDEFSSDKSHFLGIVSSDGLLAGWRAFCP
jgi:hypothetical protein